jgi:hypothetical protein
MESQVFDQKAYSLSPVDLIPPDELEDLGEVDTRRLDYERYRRLVDVDDVAEVVATRLASSVALRSLIEDALRDPLDADRPHVHVSEALRLTHDVLVEINMALDDIIGMLASTMESIQIWGLCRPPIVFFNREIRIPASE